MLRDRIRNETYRKAITESVKPNDIVLDVGAGTGILSLFAVQAGARKVYAVERTKMARLAERIMEKNGIGDRVEVIQSDIEKINLSDQVDVIVSEWMGRYGIDEYMHIPVLMARDRWLKPGGIMLPESVTALMAPVWDRHLHQSLNFWRSQPYGLDLSPIADGTAQEIFWSRYTITEYTLLARPKEMWKTHLRRISLAEVRGPFHTSLSFPASRDGKLSGLATWFHADFGHGITLTNAPDAPMTHWGRWVFPLNYTIDIQKGMNIAVEFSCEPAEDDYSRNMWSVRVEDGPWEHHDTWNAIS